MSKALGITAVVLMACGLFVPGIIVLILAGLADDPKDAP